LLKCYITDRKNEERKKTKEEKKKKKNSMKDQKDIKIRAITDKTCNEGDVN